MHARILLLFAFLFAGAWAAPSGVFDVRAFGATGDGRALDTAAINRAIVAAHQAGGGVVFFSAGVYLATSIRLQSRIALHLGPGAVIEAASHLSQRYDEPESQAEETLKYQDFGHSHWRNSLISGIDLEDISIVGPGRINGFGLFRDNVVPTGGANKAIALKNCRNVLLRDFTVFQGGHFAILATGVDNLTIDNLTLDTNRDGMDLDCCRDVRVANCRVNSPFDDAICLKSSFALGELRHTENVTITNCQVSGYDMGTLLDGSRQRKVDFRQPSPVGVTGRIAFGPLPETVARQGGPTGRIKLGTESTGGFRNIAISNCTFDYCRGLALEAVDGGALEDVVISNLTMRDITNAPLFVRLGNRARGPGQPPVGALRRVAINNVVAYNSAPRFGCIVSGTPGACIEDLVLSNIHLEFRGGGPREWAAIVPEEHERDYPEPHTFGPMPAYGFFVRHVRGFSMEQVKLVTLSEDQRPPLRLDDATEVRLSHVQAAHVPTVPVLIARKVRALQVESSRGLPELRDRDVLEDSRF